jgi:small subunit ribosomal protein S16
MAIAGHNPPVKSVWSLQGVSFVAVRLRLKRLGRKNRECYRLVAMDARTPRDGKAIEELGHYDPHVANVDARAILNGERIDYWLSVGALPSEAVNVLIKKYGKDGTHLSKQQEALEQLKSFKPQAPAPWTPPPKPKVEAAPPEAPVDPGEAQAEATEGEPATENAEASAAE